MKKNFGDKSLAIHFMQQMMHETYNDAITVSGEYYKHHDMNYGFAHFIAKYLNYKYPLLDKQSKDEYAEHAISHSDTIRSIHEPISLMNYFLCSNDGGRLKFYLQSTPEEYINNNQIYSDIYNQYMVLYNVGGEGATVIKPDPDYKRYFNKIDLPLFTTYYVYKDKDRNIEVYGYNNDIIFPLETWSIKKDICEIDDFIASYILGRTITPKSPRDDIYYAQQLLIRDRNIEREERGVWCMSGCEGTIYDLTQTIINYQKAHVNNLNSTPLFVTGYFDIFTESCVRKELGETENGIRGL